MKALFASSLRDIRTEEDESSDEGFFVTTARAWDVATQNENPVGRGLGWPMGHRALRRYDLDAFVQIDSEDEDPDTTPDPAMVERLATLEREADEERLTRRVHEKQDPEGLYLLGMSPDSLDREIERLEARIRSHSETRNRLRKEALALSPHSLDIIGSPRKGLS